MGEIEIGKCDVCGKENVALRRKYYYYPNVACECHIGSHTEVVKHCKDCIPQEPKTTQVTFFTRDLK